MGGGTVLARTVGAGKAGTARAAQRSRLSTKRGLTWPCRRCRRRLCRQRTESTSLPPEDRKHVSAARGQKARLCRQRTESTSLPP
eukprot:334163-Chlamydomonas_euryale.AAC.1